MICNRAVEEVMDFGSHVVGYDSGWEELSTTCVRVYLGLTTVESEQVPPYYSNTCVR